MPNTYTWSVEKMDTQNSSVIGKTDLVVTVYYIVTGTDGTHTVEGRWQTGITYVKDGPYTPFDQLKEEDVIGWVKGQMDEEEITNRQAIINHMIAQAADPPVTGRTPPWGTPA